MARGTRHDSGVRCRVHAKAGARHPASAGGEADQARSDGASEVCDDRAELMGVQVEFAPHAGAAGEVDAPAVG
jgi:hypothetical protein